MWVHRPGTQQGMATLAVSLFMLIALTSITLYTARALILEQRIARNESHAVLALEAAEAGIGFGMAYLNANRGAITHSGSGGWGSGAAWNPCPGPVGDTGSPARDLPCGDGIQALYGSDWLAYQDIPDTPGTADPGVAYRVHFLSPGNGGDTFPFPLIQIVSQGRSDIPDGVFDHGGGRAIVQTTVRARQLFRNTPPVPLMVRGDLTDSAPATGPVSIWGRTDGIAAGVPFSVWSGGEADPLPNDASLSNQTCDPFDYPLCTPLSGGTDIVEGGESPEFPVDLFRFLFGLPAGDSAILQDISHGIFSDCSGASALDGGLYWITGDCELTDNTGSLEAPLMLVIQGNLVFNGGMDYFGALYLLPGGAVSATGAPTVHGALVVDGDLDLGSGGLLLVYDPVALHNLDRVGGSYAQVPGSWNDEW